MVFISHHAVAHSCEPAPKPQPEEGTSDVFSKPNTLHCGSTRRVLRPPHMAPQTQVPRYPVNKGASPRKSDAQSDCLLQMQALPAAAWYEGHIDKFTQLRPGRTTQKGLLHTEDCHSPRRTRTKQSSTPAGEQTGRPSKTRAHQGRAHMAQGSQRILRASTLALAPQNDSMPTLSPAKDKHARRRAAPAQARRAGAKFISMQRRLELYHSKVPAGGWALLKARQADSATTAL